MGGQVMISDELRENVKKIPPSGEWWHLSGEENYLRLAEKLVGYGLSDEEALDILKWAYAAAANEFGA